MATIANNVINIHPSPSAYIFPFVVGGPITLISTAAYYRIGNSSLNGLICSIVILGLAFFFVKSHRISLSNEILSSYGPFFRKRTIKIGEIENLKMRIGGESFKERLLPPFRLEIISRHSDKRDFWINLKLYKRNDIKMLIEM